ncbi:MAG: hypothetical protein GF335_01400, partial [Candidatus Moranbacteria bacterium]|nr:hypothetical protein [Candidatus Moranbacteria bacterium]
MKKLKTKGKYFSDFTNLYELSKTLRFSLIPVLTEKQEQEILTEKNYSSKDQITRQDRTEKFYRENKKEIFDVDIERKKQYRKLKYYLTELHKFFIKDALEELKKDKEINFSNLFDYWKQYEKTTNDSKKVELAKKINIEKEKLAKYFGNKEGKYGVFHKIAEKYYDFLEENLKEDEKILDNTNKKQRKNNILLSQNVLLLLDKKIKDGSIKEKIEKQSDDNIFALNFIDINEEQRNLIEYFKGWSTYFKNFNEIRANLYKDDGRKEETSETDEKSKINKANTGQITTRVLDENFEIFLRNVISAERNKEILNLNDYEDQNIVDGKDILKPDFYLDCLLQTDINIYNKKIGKLNSFFNRKNQEKGTENKINFLKTLYKQLLLDDKIEDEKEIVVKEFLDEQEFIQGLEDFRKHSWEKIELILNFFDIEELQKNLDEATLNENKLHFYCNEIFGDWAYFRKLYYGKNEVKEKDKSKSKKEEFKDKEGLEKSEFSLTEIKELLNNYDKEEFKKDLQKGNFIGRVDTEKLEYQDELDNFKNFLNYLKFYFDSFTKGRELLTKREKEDLKKFNEIKKELEEAREKGEKIDELLLGKISEENFRKDIKESIGDKKENLERIFDEYKKSIEAREKL